ncbi:sacsin N-terminal ATP-binding-like domain-containing protein [Pedobacter sp. MR22-3]|uniref:sacsin N-terminal ATP-binding-like domain-containing protein n=1 Tax=Pedobacter sp. MR22-3 TaxID=2994552 RepID=UPI00224569A4|nr:DUF3883 domain-containing protein [Pedobacter sp. MR22-3]MCX2582709.1 DUF3883 domain-containing protein [Pedobacter sp. MR22-3]
MTFKDEIQKLKDKNINTYTNDWDRFIADFNREQELTKEYNGRQLLELLQNADDAGSSNVLISLNTREKKLTISNEGKKFGVGGIKSLMLANLSTKTKIEYIGNKGLGFRSILNWANIVTIFSNGCKISFSPVIAKEIFENKIGLSQKEQLVIKQERNLAASAIPFPVLAIPEVVETIFESKWSTVIEIDFKPEYLKDIEDQIKELSEEVLLFLNNIGSITVIKNGITEIALKSEKLDFGEFSLITIRDKSWKVFEESKELPAEYQDKDKNEKQHFQLKVAFQENLSDSFNKIFNFFPTQLSLSLPCIVHGTFELNSSRNHLNESKKNGFILENLVGLLQTCSIYLSKLSLDWRAYQLLTPRLLQSDSKLIDTFYSNLNKAKQSSLIFPCVDRFYRNFQDIHYYNNGFNGFFMKHFPKALPTLLIPFPDEIDNIFNGKTVPENEVIDIMDALSRDGLTISERTELIVQLSTLSLKEETTKASLLINEKHIIIDKNDVAFTPVIRSGEEFNIPKSVKVDFMNSELYDALVKKLEHRFEKKEPRSRELQRIIKNIVNLQPYDSNNVIEKIIIGTADALDSIREHEDKNGCIREMVSALYYNFRNIENRQERVRLKVPLMSRAGRIITASDLFLSGTYPSGRITEEIYSGEFSSDNYLQEIAYWNLNQENSDNVEDFFLWLGVNKFSKIETFSLQNNWSEQDYINFSFKNGTERPDNFEINKIQRESFVSRIVNFDQIKTLSLSKMILLAYYDTFIRKQLEGNDERINWYYVTQRPAISFKFSYLRYQFISSRIFSKFLLEDGNDQFNKLINDGLEIDYAFLLSYGINKADVRAILLKMGAKESFGELEPVDIYDILRAIPTKDKDGKGSTTQKIYKLALDGLVDQNSNYPVPQDLIFFSKMGDREEYRQANEVYYSDNTILPKTILNTLYLLNLPKRSGEDKVEEYFGVKSLREFKISLDSGKIKYNHCDTDFSVFFESIKPYLLAYRLSSPNLKRKTVDGEAKRREARLIRESSIHIVDQAFFSFGEKRDIQVEQKEFINVKGEFYYRDFETNSLESLRKDSIFCDAFAEMICIIFKLNDLKNDFRQVLKNDITDTVHLARQDLGEDTLQEAYELLGISRLEIDFWNNILTFKKMDLLREPMENHAKLKANLEQSLGIIMNEDYDKVDFMTFETNESFALARNIIEQLELELSDFLPMGIGKFHTAQFFNLLKDNEHNFKQLTWENLNKNPKNQRSFIKSLNQYNQGIRTRLVLKGEETKYLLDVPYLDILSAMISAETGIDLQAHFTETEIAMLYPRLLALHHIEENDISNEHIRSLLYFSGNEIEVQSYLSAYHPVLSPDDKSDDRTTPASQKGKLIETKIGKGGKIFSGRTGNDVSGSSWVHSNNGEKGKKRKGKDAEQLVYDTLIGEFGLKNVRWVSGNSNTPDKNDKLHYDMEYKNHQGQWKNVEVKAIMENQFIISGAEKEFGLSHPDSFEMALVRDTNIFLVKDIFKLDVHESFENNSKFNAQPKDYIFTFNLTGPI